MLYMAWEIARIPTIVIAIFGILALAVPAFRENTVLRSMFIVGLIGVILWIVFCLIMWQRTFGGAIIFFMI
jgi:FtsH-binding integral membrane protein